MEMYRCEQCGHLFEEGEQAKWQEDRGEFWGAPCTETVTGCPICKGDYVDIEPCKICGSYNHDYKEEFCDECKKNVKQVFQNFVNKVFTAEERELLNELYEGEYI